MTKLKTSADDEAYRSVKGIMSAQHQVLMLGVIGSQMYGTSTPESDFDYAGIFALPHDFHPSIFSPPEEVRSHKNTKPDVVFTELSRYLALAADVNPTVIELMWMPQDVVLKTTPAWDYVVANRGLFVSRKGRHTFSGYAYGQVQKAQGQNKMVMKEWPVEKPKKEQFCWVIPMGDWLGKVRLPVDYMPSRPIPYLESGIDLSEFHVAGLERMSQAYRLYHYGQGAKGVFRGDDTLVVESIPFEDERKCFAGLLVYDEHSFSRALKDHARYWDWRRNRNEARWGDQSDNFKFDRKNMMHCMRLMVSCEHLLTHGEPLVRVDAKTLQYLRDIREGRHEYKEIMTDVQRRLDALPALEAKSPLPRSTDKAAILKVCKEAHHIYWGQTGRDWKPTNTFNVHAEAILNPVPVANPHNEDGSLETPNGADPSE